MLRMHGTNKEETGSNLWRAAREACHAEPKYGILHVRFVGLFQWSMDSPCSKVRAGLCNGNRRRRAKMRGKAPRINGAFGRKERFFL